MPTRSYYFPDDFRHLEAVLSSEYGEVNDEKLRHFRDRGIPPIITIGAIPLFLGISPKIVYSFCFNQDRHYRQFKIKKRSGKPRELNSPRTYLKVAQWWILDNILSQMAFPDYVFGFVRGRSAVGNAEYHFGSRHILNMDVEHFFPTIKESKVSTIFENLGYSSDVSDFLAKMCCLNKALPQGAPTSPALANLAFQEVDVALMKIAGNRGLKYSRYADDITFSSLSKIDSDVKLDVEATLRQFGFKANRDKTRFAGTGDRMEITGVVVNERLQPPRSWRKLQRAKLHRLENEPRLTRRNVSYLYAVKSMTSQFPKSSSMQRLSSQAAQILESKLKTVVGYGDRPSLPNGLTIRQAEVLAALSSKGSEAEIAALTGMSEKVVSKRLEEAFVKAEVKSLAEARDWAIQNL